jgi:preprotein translocase subunit SecE
MNPELFQIGGSWITTGIVWVLVLAAVAGLFAYRAPIRNFTSEVKVELAKASWPWEPKEKGAKKYKELIDSTVVVVIAMLLLSGYVALWDFTMTVLMGKLLK